jgi:hypothetical protein
MIKRNVNLVPRAAASSDTLQAWPGALTHWSCASTAQRVFR